MPEFTIQVATESDVPQILILVREFARFAEMSEFCTVTEERLRDALFGKQRCIESLIAFDESRRAIGYALFFQNYASYRGQRGLYLEDLYVAPQMQKLGVGSALMRNLAKIAFERGCERLDWNFLIGNEPAIRFYRKLGAEADSDERHFKLVGANFERLATDS